MFHLLLQAGLWLMPWRLRRRLLNRIYGFSIAPTAQIGLSIIRARRLVMLDGARISNLTYIKGLDELVLLERALIGPLNWITAFPKNDMSFFSHVTDRDPSLRIGRDAAVTGRHLLDCTGGITVGAFATVGGWGSQILTHSIDVARGRQDAAPVAIGDYSFVGTRVVLLKGSALPARSILAAGSVLSSADTAPLGLYSGVPAQRQRELPADYSYFTRQEGFVR